MRTPDILRLLPHVRRRRRRLGPWGCGPAEITYRNSLLPVPESEYEPMSYPDREILRDDAGQAAAHGVHRRRDHPVHARRRWRMNEAHGRRLHGGVARPVREVRLLPHGAADLRPAGRRDGGGAPVLHQPLEHLAGDDRARAPTASRCWTRWGTRSASRYRQRDDADDHLLPEPGVPGRAPSCARWPSETVERLEPGDAGDGRRPDA